MRVLLALWLAGSLSAQGLVEPPAAGVYADRAGQLRTLFGVPGGWVPGPVREIGVVSASSGDGVDVWKTADAVWIRWDQTVVRRFDAPGGRARFRVHPGEVSVWFEEGQFAWTWQPAMDGFSPAGWLTEKDFPARERIGDWTLVRGESGLLLEQPGAVLALPEAADATPKLYEIVDLNQVPVTGVVAFPEVGAGENLIKRLRIRNESTEPLNVTRLSVSGAGFTITDGFTPPRIIAAGRFEDFWLRFFPSASGTHKGVLTINATTWEVTGNAPVWANLEIRDPPNWVRLVTGQSFGLGSVERRTPIRRRLRWHNGNSTPVPVAKTEVSGAGFQCLDGCPGVAQLEPDAAVEFEVEFLAETAGTYRGVIESGGRQYTLTATATEFPLPAPTVGLPATLDSANQVKLTVGFAGPVRSPGNGLVKIEFQPAAGLTDDPAIVFAATGTRTALFRATEGAAQADFSGQDGIVFQTGTTAGTLTVSVTFGAYTETRQIPIQARAVAVASARALRSDTRLEVRLTGYDNTHQAGRIAFTFYQKNGTIVAPGRIEAVIDKAMQDYFAANPRLGGSFSLMASFPVNGVPAEVDRVDVEVTNPAGSTRLESIPF